MKKKTIREIAMERFNTFLFVGEASYKNIAWQWWKKAFDDANISLPNQYTKEDIINAYKAGATNYVNKTCNMGIEDFIECIDEGQDKWVNDLDKKN